eukprot:TRINITY_DN9824_c0_g1_i2.p1 TRINITY_DN9824_c0_g1~~TRINITY_DN9824_c0_g1_i2.p1  ORF type:complete len:458 (-),score=90.75 TRINITY_DN9824_c0_g1_i2:176-1549(-)
MAQHDSISHDGSTLELNRVFLKQNHAKEEEEEEFDFEDPSQNSRALMFQVAIHVLLFIVFVCAIPVYNKRLMRRRAGFPFPLTITFFQLAGTVLILLLFQVVRKLWMSSSSSWIFGPGFTHKLRHIYPAGILFGLKLGLTNWGLKLVDFNIHILLQSCSLFWTCLFSSIVVREVPTCMEALACLGTVVGTVFIALHAQHDTHLWQDKDGSFWFPLLINLSTPVLEGCAITFLRYGVTHLSHKAQASLPPIAQPHRHTSHGFSRQSNPRALFADLDVEAPEFTLIKLMLSACAVLPFAVLFEGYNVLHRYHETSFEALEEARPLLFWMLLGGTLLTLGMQVNVTMLAMSVSAISVGMVGDVKVIPQTLIGVMFFSKEWSLTLFHTLGAFLVCISVSFYTFLRYRAIRQADHQAALASAAASAQEVGFWLDSGTSTNPSSSNSSSSQGGGFKYQPVSHA